MDTKVYEVNSWESIALGHPRRGAEVKYLGPAYWRNGTKMHGWSRLQFPGGVVYARPNSRIELEVPR